MATLIGARHGQAIWRDYLELTKPKVVVLMLITSLVGMFLATRAGVPWTVLIFGNLGIALCAGGAAAVNHVVDRRIDALMARTHKRPAGRGAGVARWRRWPLLCCWLLPGWRCCWRSPTRWRPG